MKTAVVTGGNRGIGFAVCMGLAERGFHVFLTSRDAMKGQQAVGLLQEAGWQSVQWLPMDVTRPDSIDAFAQRLAELIDHLDVLVNNAGIDLERGGRIYATESALFTDTLITNALGPLLVTRALAPLLARSVGAQVINVSSHSGQLSGRNGFSASRTMFKRLFRLLLRRMGNLHVVPAEGRLRLLRKQHGTAPVYRMSKAALNALTRVLASELADQKTHVNSMSPGWARTAMGGEAAPRSVEQGADTVIWLATGGAKDGSGNFYFERKPIPW